MWKHCNNFTIRVVISVRVYYWDYLEKHPRNLRVSIFLTKKGKSGLNSLLHLPISFLRCKMTGTKDFWFGFKERAQKWNRYYQEKQLWNFFWLNELYPFGNFLKDFINPLSANPTKWPNTLKQFIGKLPTNCLSVFGLLWNWYLKG